MSSATEPIPGVIPPPPWRLGGRAWIGLFRADGRVSVPTGLRPLFGSRWVVIILARYLTGTLRYDELIVGTPVRRGFRVGVWVADIWVSLERSRHAGRSIWGLPKELAEFRWHEGGVRVHDRSGLVAALQLDDGHLRHLPVCVPAAGVGQLGGDWAWTTARVRASLGTTRLTIADWSDRLPFRPRARPVLSAAVRSFRMTVPTPRVIAA